MMKAVSKHLGLLRHILKGNTPTVVLFIATLSLMALQVTFPYLPREGDAFGNWWPYFETWKKSGLGAALHVADAAGRYPGYPFLLLVFSFVFRIENYLDLLLFSRIICVLLTSLSLFVLASVWTKKIKSRLLFSLIFISHPTILGILSLNTQDSYKLAFFCLSCFFYLEILKSHFNWSECKKKYIGFWTFSILLCSLRATELVSIFGLVSAGTLSFTLLDRKQKHVGFVGRFGSFLSKSLVLLAPAFLFVILLHLFAYRHVHHWGFSGPGGGTPRLWLKLYLSEIKPLLKQGNWIMFFEQLFSLPIYVWVWKSWFFIKDYIFLASYMTLIGGDLYRDVWLQPSSAAFSSIILITFGMYLLLEQICRQLKKTEAVSCSFLGSLLSTLVFWVFFLNHYETRYWIVVWASIIFLFFTRVFNANFENTINRYSPVIIISIFLSQLYIFCIFSKMNKQITSEINRLESIAEKACNDSRQAIVLDKSTWHWAPTRYFIYKECKNIEITYVDELGTIGPKPLPITFSLKVIENDQLKDANCRSENHMWISCDLGKPTN